MGRSLLASGALHLAAAVVVVLLAARGTTRPLPPVYQVNLVSAATLAAEPRRPEPQPEETVEEEAPPEPEAVEEIPDPEREPERPERQPRETPRAGPPTAQETGPDLPITLEGRPFRFPWYLEQLVRKIERNWRPSTNTMRATVYFRIARNGRISEIEVSEPSGNFLFDQAAQRAVEASAPMPPLPGEYDGDYLGVYFDFDTRVQIR
jgi:protein TonB